MPIDFSVLPCPKPVDLDADWKRVRCGQAIYVIERTANCGPSSHNLLVAVACRRTYPARPHFYRGDPRWYWLPREIAQAASAHFEPEQLAYLGRMTDLTHTAEYEVLLSKFAGRHTDAWPSEWDAYIRYLAAPFVPDDISSLV